MQVKFLRKYFLGLLDHGDMEAAELQILEDSDSEGRLAQAEDELIEDYLEGALTKEETEAFETNYRTTDERRSRVEFLRLLKDKALGFEETDAERTGIFDKLTAFFRMPRIALVLGAVALIAAIGITWRFVIDNSRNPLQAEVVALNKRDLSDLGGFANLKTISLASGSLRSTDSLAALPQQELTEQVLFRLALPNLVDSKGIYTIIIFRDGRKLQTVTQTPLQNQEVRILLPKAFLTKGEYQIALERDSEKFSYYFSVR